MSMSEIFINIKLAYSTDLQMPFINDISHMTSHKNTTYTFVSCHKVVSKYYNTLRLI